MNLNTPPPQHQDTPSPHSQTTLSTYSQSSLPSHSQATLPPRSQTSLPPRSQTSLPPHSQTTLPPQSQTTPPPRSQTTPPPHSQTTPLPHSQHDTPIDPTQYDYASTIEDDLSDLTSLNSSQINNLLPGGIQCSITPSYSFSFLEPKPKVRRSWIWRHGIPVTINNKTYWQCNHCSTSQIKRYADTSTKHQIEHLKRHCINEQGPIPVSGEPSIIEQAFGNSLQRIQFNSDLFQSLLLHWIIQSNISFSQV